METTECFRPVGPGEYDLLVDLDFAKWPPRLPGQPIFYPVTNELYAKGINNWNVKDFGAGYITRFFVKKNFMDQYEIHCVGAKNDTEWWIPAEDLELLNQNIVGKIEVIDEVRKVE